MLESPSEDRPFRALDFFAGSGLVSLGLEPEFATVWANDVCARKAAVYRANLDERPLPPRRHRRGVAARASPRRSWRGARSPARICRSPASSAGMRKGHALRPLLGVAAGDRRARPPPDVGRRSSSPRTSPASSSARGSAHFRRAAPRAARARLPRRRPGHRRQSVRAAEPSARVRHRRREGFALDGLVQRGPTEPFHPDAARSARPTPSPTRGGSGGRCRRRRPTRVAFAICASDAPPATAPPRTR